MPNRSRHFLDAATSPWPMLIALIASVPAFYDSMMPTPATWATWMYVVSGAVVLISAWRVQRLVEGRTRSAHTGKTRPWGHHPLELKLDWFLGAALLLNAVLPQSNESEPSLIWRLIIAVLMLYRLLKISKPLFTETGLARLLAMGATVLALCGIGFYWLDPEVNSLHDGLWLAFSTAATVGYGDIVPSNTASRIFSVFVVLLGYGLLSLVTASIAAMFVGSQERKVESEILHDMHMQLKEVRHEIAELRLSIESAKREQQQASVSPTTSSRPKQPDTEHH
ncbi:MAG: two pore domain potassium channel family protein [Aquabacterium sp.]|uniref:potassium channel family protein n=1 Tax=Aquabacterium sp. TaxID=1872578 RepID=UPI0025BC143F|nr:potassium channel family protein [Aquabacterium sp.]MBI5925979.1 two pore domain potassium channel family protein [Aquabacterium sp.]